MQLSYKIIKNQEIGSNMDNFEIPIIPTEGLYKYEDGKGAEKNEQVEVRVQVQEMIKKAEYQAKSIIDEAKQEANSIKKKARESGYQGGFKKGQDEGYKQGYDNAIIETNEIIENARQLLSNAHRESREYIEKTREEILELASSMAKSIIHFNVDVRDEGIIEMVKNALKHAEERKQIIIRSHPDSILILQTNQYQFKKICPNAIFTFLEDKGIEGQGCIIETEKQVINLEIDSQLENLVNALLEKRNDNEI